MESKAKQTTFGDDFFSGNATFYPTPAELITLMIEKIQGQPNYILDPSAGRGDIIDAMCGRSADYDVSHPHYRFIRSQFAAIECDDDLRAVLIGKGIKVVDTDFLAFEGPDKFDLIIANPPFNEGDRHLLKAIEIMYCGQIIFLLNAETIRNPFTHTRKILAKELEELDAEIEFLPNAFAHAERQARVDIALVNITVQRNVEDDLFANVDDKAEGPMREFEENHEVTTGRRIEELVAEYNQVIDIGTETIVGYYRNYRKIGGYIGLNKEAKSQSPDGETLTKLMQNTLNDVLVTVRKDFWRRTLTLKEVSSRLTESKQKEFDYQIEKRCDMDFTERNIRQFILNLMSGYRQTLMDAVVNIFEKFTIRHCYSGGLYDENIHYFNGWKTNKAFKVNRKVIIPVYGSYGGAFWDNDFKKWHLNWQTARNLLDIDIVMNYFDGMTPHYRSIPEAVKDAFGRGNGTNVRTAKIRSTYFTITVHKKGTVHLTFNDPNILRRFNVAACIGKGWLPHDYGTKPYTRMSDEERDVVNSFEGETSYQSHTGEPLFDQFSTLLQIGKI